MEKRAIIAAVLMAALLLIYQTFFLPTGEPPKPAPEATAPATPAPGTAPTTPPVSPSTPPMPTQPPAIDPSPKSAEAARPPQRLATVDGPLYRAVVSSEGGKFQEFSLKYRGDKPLVIVGELGPTGLILEADGVRDVVPMELNQDNLKIGAASPSGDLVLKGDRGTLKVQETLRFRAYTYTVDAMVRIENRGSVPKTVGITLPWSTRQSWKGATERFVGQHPTEVIVAGKSGLLRLEDLTAVGNHVTDADWVGVGSGWYLAALIPKTPGFKTLAAGEPAPTENKEAAGRATIAVSAAPTIAPGQAWESHVVMYVGPKEYDKLQALGLEAAINFGGFPVPESWGGLPMSWLGVPILQLMNWIYNHLVSNYGIAIILLTVVSKVLFYPLTVKSMRSMKAMQTLGPQVNALRNKYKNDPQRLQKETLELYRQHKVNPMGGCLPMIAQVPIFYALYLALSVSVELQNAPFICFGRVFGVEVWICDLASQDPTYILPILMGVSMFVQQKMTPMAGDPRQAKMMLVMPFVFTFMFLNLPSGLVLYWTVSNVLQIAQQWYMDRAKRSPREVKDAVRA